MKLMIDFEPPEGWSLKLRFKLQALTIVLQYSRRWLMYLQMLLTISLTIWVPRLMAIMVRTFAGFYMKHGLKKHLDEMIFTDNLNLRYMILAVRHLTMHCW